MTTLNLAITSGANDAYQNDVGDTDTAATAEICDQTDEYFAFRFESVTIPNAATISSADFQVYITDGTTDEPQVDIYGDDSDNSAVLTTGSENNNISSRTATTAVVQWDSSDLSSSGGLASTPDVSTIIQEIVDRGGWSSGNSLTLIIHGTSGLPLTRDLGIDMYDLNSNRAAQLDIEYTTGGGGGGGLLNRMVVEGLIVQGFAA